MWALLYFSSGKNAVRVGTLPWAARALARVSFCCVASEATMDLAVIICVN